MSKAFRAPKVVRKHPAFKKELSRQEAEIFLSLPGQRYVLRLNQEKNAIVISFVNGSGNIVHSEIVVDEKGQVLINNSTEQFANIEEFVKSRMRRTNASPTLSELREIPELKPHIIDEFNSQHEKTIWSNKQMFFIRKSKSTETGLVFMYFNKKAKKIDVIPVNCTPRGFEVFWQDDSAILGDLIQVVNHCGLVLQENQTPQSSSKIKSFFQRRKNSGASKSEKNNSDSNNESDDNNSQTNSTRTNDMYGLIPNNEADLKLAGKD